MKNIQKLILEAYGDIKEEKETIKLDTLPKPMQDRLKDRYGEFSKHDFISSDMGTYFKTTGVNKTTGQVSHKIIALPSFANLYNEYKGIIADIKSLMRSDDVRKDKEARELFELIKTNFRKLQRYLRTERPEQYEIIRMRAALQEIHGMFVSHGSLIVEEKKFLNESMLDSIKNENPNFKILKKGPYYRYLPTDDLFTDLDQLGHHGLQRSPDNLAVIKTADELLDILDDMHIEDPERALAFSDQNNDIIKFQGKVLNESMLDEEEETEEITSAQNHLELE